MNNYSPKGFNIELTTCCPLRCPQCYCSLEGGKHIPLDIALKIIDEAGKNKVEHLELSGGETLCYPHLYELISAANSYGIETYIAISGWGFNRDVLDKLVESGLNGIFVSLNGHTEEINKITRDGYSYAMSALSVLKDSGFSNVNINWVMHRQNADFLPEMISLAESYGVRTIMIMQPKPTSSYELNTLPTKEQMLMVADMVKNNHSSVELVVEGCFSPLLALIGRNAFWGNLNRGIMKGCTAGLLTFSVNVNGEFSPCRHLEIFERFDSVIDYWENSLILEKIRNLEKSKKEPCVACVYGKFCRHCLALNYKIHNDLYIGNKFCRIFEAR